MAASTSGGSSGGGGGGILYALVARGSVVLAEHAAVSGNSSVVAVGLLGKVPQEEGFRASWAAGQHAFHILSTGGLTYLCMAEQVSLERQGRASPGNASLRCVRALFCEQAMPCARRMLLCTGLPPFSCSPLRICPPACLPACLLPPHCMQTLGKRLPFAFLADARQQFEQRYAAAVSAGAVAYECNTDFAPVLRDRIHFFNTDPRWVSVRTG